MPDFIAQQREMWSRSQTYFWVVRRYPMAEDMFSELLDVPLEAPVKREVCSRCRRPIVVCVCSCFPSEPVPVDTRVIILQHPNEEHRVLATVPLLQECIPRDRCHVIRGKRFGTSKSDLLDKALSHPATILLYPGKSAADLRSLPQEPIGLSDDAALIVIDGTWAQAKGMVAQSPGLQPVRQVKLSGGISSEYVIRTQPTRGSVSTLESVAHTLAWLEQKPDIVEALVRPLRALCQYQLDHGAVAHQSKDDPNYIPRNERKLRLRQPQPQQKIPEMEQNGTN